MWEAYTVKQIEQFFEWLTGSSEAAQYETVVDGISQLAEIYLSEAKSGRKHGLQAYGDMAISVLSIANSLYHLPEKHVVLTAKLSLSDEGGELVRKRPYFPGRELNIHIPHLYDEILCLGTFTTPEFGVQKCFITSETVDLIARDRSERLAQYMPPDLAAIITACSS